MFFDNISFENIADRGNYQELNFAFYVISAPYFGDPAPQGGKVGEAYFELWEHEVVEAFFLNDKEQYLELEFGPHGQHLMLILNGNRNAIK